MCSIQSRFKSVSNFNSLQKSKKFNKPILKSWANGQTDTKWLVCPEEDFY